jgi:hypothetical protein
LVARRVLLHPGRERAARKSRPPAPAKPSLTKAELDAAEACDAEMPPVAVAQFRNRLSGGFNVSP